jgi:uridine phosphorylase
MAFTLFLNSFHVFFSSMQCMFFCSLRFLLLGLAWMLPQSLPVGKTERYSLFKVGPVIAVNHGMGQPSISILVHEVTKLLYYARATDVVYIRTGTSGGLGVPPGSVVLATEGVSGDLEGGYPLPILGKTVRRPAMPDAALTEDIGQCAREFFPKVNLVFGKTLGADCFYEGQGRLDGAICEYTLEDKFAFLREAVAKDVRNIEMESGQFLSFCMKVGVPAAVVCCTLLDRMKGDQVDSPTEVLEKYSMQTLNIVAAYIMKKLGK